MSCVLKLILDVNAGHLMFCEVSAIVSENSLIAPRIDGYSPEVVSSKDVSDVKLPLILLPPVIMTSGITIVDPSLTEYV
jgi:hypothetical protein